jgi:hypothetical protein
VMAFKQLGDRFRVDASCSGVNVRKIIEYVVPWTINCGQRSRRWSSYLPSN